MTLKRHPHPGPFLSRILAYLTAGSYSLGLDLTTFEDVEATTAIIRITGGNFRLLQRLFAQIARILAINHLDQVTKEVVEAARDSLVIGTN